MKSIEIYTDGSCLNNPGNGGWAGILMYNGTEKCICGAERNTTNNRMELMAVIKSIECLKEKCNVNIYSDSSYVINAFENGWLDKWEKNNWKTSTNKDVLNRDLWERLSALVKLHNVKFIKVKGHSDNIYNNRCDEMARGEASKL
ncbi:MAG: ribonuclease HI [Christensenellales bacterium]